MTQENNDKAEELFDLASDCRLLADLDAGELKTLSRYCRLKRLSGGEQLFAQGDRNAGLWFLINGQVGIYKEGGSEAQARHITTVRSGHTLGEISLMDAQPASASALAIGDCTLLLLQRDRFELLLKEAPGLGITLLRKVGQQLGRRLRQTTGMLVDHLE